MFHLDRREEFKDFPWQQGKLLLTNTTLRWSEEQKDKAEFLERCLAFVNFSPEDQGKSRIYIYRFESPKECSKAVKEHNTSLREK